MNTEINFLEKQPKKYLFPLLLAIIFLFLLALVLILVFLQQNQYERAIETEKGKISQIESLLQKNNQESSTVQQLTELKQEVDKIEDELIPNVSLYRAVLNLFDSPERLIGFEYTSSHQFVLDASFENLASVSSYLGSILEQGYILDADITSISRTEDSYRATLTFTIDSDYIREELSGHE